MAEEIDFVIKEKDMGINVLGKNGVMNTWKRPVFPSRPAMTVDLFARSTVPSVRNPSK